MSQFVSVVPDCKDKPKGSLVNCQKFSVIPDCEGKPRGSLVDCQKLSFVPDCKDKPKGVSAASQDCVLWGKDKKTDYIRC